MVQAQLLKELAAVMLTAAACAPEAIGTEADG
jgi:hypothetical protein